MHYRIVKRFRFEAGHRLMGYGGECGNVHGHSYTVEISISSRELNEMGMVMDFKELKKLIDIEKLDHTLILHKKDPIKKLFEQNCVLLNANPTAEVLANFIFKRVSEKLMESKCKVDYVRVWETIDAYAEFSED